MSPVFNDVLSQHDKTERVDRPERERFLTLRLNGRGAVQRKIGEGKTPQIFTGYRVKAGQFIYSRIDARNGAFAVVPKELDGAVVSKDFPVFNIDTAKVDSRYLLGVVTAPPFVDGIKRLSFGATNRQRVKEEVFLSLPLALPSLDEQRRIAAILDKADELRSKRRQALAHLDTLTQSIFHSMFEPQSHPVEPLGSVARFFGGNSLPEGETFVGQDGGHLLLKVSDMNRAGNDRELRTSGFWSIAPGSKASTCPQGCVVIPKRGASISTNKKRLTVRDSILDPNLMAVQPLKPLNPSYLFAWFEGFDLTEITSGSSVPQLNKQDLQPLPITVPPMELQRTFATRVAAVERLKETHRKHLAELDTLFASLQHRAFRGEL